MTVRLNPQPYRWKPDSYWEVTVDVPNQHVRVLTHPVVKSVLVISVIAIERYFSIKSVNLVVRTDRKKAVQILRRLLWQKQST